MTFNNVKAEFLKIRRSNLIVITIAVTLFITLVSGSLYYGATERSLDVLRVVVFQNFLQFIFPMLLAFIASSLVRIERKNNAINIFLTSSIDKTRLYITKILLLSLFNIIILTGLYLIYITYIFIYGHHTEFNILSELPYFFTLLLVGTLISSFQLVFSIYFKRIVMPITLATFLTISGIFFTAHPTYHMFHIWGYPTQIIYAGYSNLLISSISIVLLILINLLGMYIFPKKIIQ